MSAAAIRQVQPARLQLLYTLPAAVFADYARRLATCAEGFHDLFELRELDRPITLARETKLAAFVSPVQPTLVILRDGVVVAEAVGDLPLTELRRIIARTVDHDHPAQ